MANLSKVHEILSHGGWAFFDVDGTLTDHSDIHPLLNEYLFLLNQVGVKCGICTGRSTPDLQRFLHKLGEPAETIFPAGFVIEDGHAIVKPGLPLVNLEVITDSDVLVEIKAFTMYFLAHWGQVDRENGWGQIEDLPVSLVMPTPYEHDGSYSIWEKGEKESSNYARVMEWGQMAVSLLGLTRLELFEVGDGTLRVLQPGLSKGSGLQLFQREGYIDLSKTVYFGDANNDIPAAQAVIRAGGVAIAVNNATQSFKDVATYVTHTQASSGIVEVIDQIFPLDGRIK
jgi:HAD superfamily hydrolase (TIGR01484 family)